MKTTHLLIVKALILASLLIALPAASAHHHTIHGQRYWYSDYHYHYHHTNYEGHHNIRLHPGTTYISERYNVVRTPARQVLINPHHTQALCQHRCTTSQQHQRPYVVITNTHQSRPTGHTHAIVHNQHRVVQTPQPAHQHAQSSVYVPW